LVSRVVPEDNAISQAIAIFVVIDLKVEPDQHACLRLNRVQYDPKLDDVAVGCDLRRAFDLVC